MTAPTFSIAGKAGEATTLAKEIFGVKVKPQLLAQAIRVWLSNQRKASAKTKTRGEISKTTAKMFRQKGTGRARHGSYAAPIFVGGGIAHGPSGEQNYKMTLPAKMRRLALLGALSVQATAGKIKIITGASKATGKTKQLAWLDENLKSLAIATKREDKFKQGIRNLDRIEITDPMSLSAYKILVNKQLIITDEALKELKAYATK